MLRMLGKDDILIFFFSIFFFFFFQKISFDMSCKLSPLETVCMKCQSLFSWTNKYFKMSAECFTLHAISIKEY